MSGAGRLLVASELRRRRRVFLLVAVVFAGSTASLLLLLGGVEGVEAAVGGEIDATLASDWRVASGRSNELAEGRFVNASTGLATRLEAAIPGSRASPRIEVQGLFLHASKYEDFDAGLIVGVDPATDGRAADVQSRIVEGRWLDAENVWIEGKPYPQLVVGAQMLETIGMRVLPANGTLSPENLLNVSAGRFVSQGAEVRPVVREGVVVGVFETGFGPIDRYTVYLHIGTARELLRIQTQDEPANVVLLRAPADAPVREAALREGLNASSSAEFRTRYLAAVFEPLDAFGKIVTGVVLTLAGGWVAHTASAAILADARRIAVLRALGVPTRLVLGPVAAVVLLAGAAGAAAGTVVASGVAFVLRPGAVALPGMPRLAFSLAVSPALVAGLVVAVLATAALASLLAGRALRAIPLTDALKD